MSNLPYTNIATLLKKYISGGYDIFVFIQTIYIRLIVILFENNNINQIEIFGLSSHH